MSVTRANDALASTTDAGNLQIDLSSFGGGQITFVGMNSVANSDILV